MEEKGRKSLLLLVSLVVLLFIGIICYGIFTESAPETETVEVAPYSFPLLEDINRQVEIMESIQNCIDTQSAANTALQEENRKLKEEINALKEERKRLINEKNTLIKEQEELVKMIEDFSSSVL